MKQFTAFLRKYYEYAKLGLFPLFLLLFPLLKAFRGIDLADTGYSFGNYLTFGTGTGSWEKLTFLSGLFGHVLTKLPFGGSLPGIRVYAGLLIGALAVISYRFFYTKMPAWLSFLAVLAAEGLCWAPGVILYNYLTYVFFFAGAVLLFRALAGNRPGCLFLAGICLGLNLFVRFPGNGLEVLLIIALWYYGVLRKKNFSEVLKETALCIGGYLLSCAVILGIMSVFYKTAAFSELIKGTLAISGSASDYTFGEMLRSILDAYLHGAHWAVYMALCAVIGIPFFVLFGGRYLKARKAFYVICIPVLFAVLYKWGMFTFRYYQKESALQWGAVFLLVSIGADIYMLVSGRVNYDWRLIAMISLLVILITPLGSNNYIWPVLNNLFFIAPVTFWTIYRFARWGRSHLDVTQKVPLFSVKAMLSAVVIAFFIQSVGVGVFYVFRDGEDGTKLSAKVSVDGNELPRLKGTLTNEGIAANLSQMAEFTALTYGTGQGSTRQYVLYGDIPGLAAYLDLDCALTTTWADLDSYPSEEFLAELNGLSDPASLPVIIMAKPVVDFPDEEDVKLAALNEFIGNYEYDMVFLNDMFVVYDVIE